MVRMADALTADDRGTEDDTTANEPRATPGTDREWGFRTRAIHAGNIPDEVTGARALPIYQTSAFVFDDTSDAAARFALQKYGNVYSRLSNPTVASFEERIASLEGGLGAVVVEERVVTPGRWDRGAMRDYGFRQTPRGATLTLSEDVLFATDSAVLRPGAIDKLRALADYLRANAGVRVAIDGYTDSRGTAAHNQALSDRRADSVRAAFDQMGVTRARFSVVGHGEANPVATNATPAGMRQNRRVEVTLLGQRADSFARY